MESDSVQTDCQYSCFISYSHDDKLPATILADAIENYHVPRSIEIPVGCQNTRHQQKFKRVFRDELELSATAKLGDSLQNALEQSYYLIVICSPISASSEWVNNEIQTFIRLGRADRIITVIVAGEPNAICEGMNASLECYPPALRQHFSNADPRSNNTVKGPYHSLDLLSVDLREIPLTRRRLRKAPQLISLLSSMLNVGYDTLRQRELARDRQRRRSLIFGSVALIATLAMLSATAWLMYQRAVLQVALNKSLQEKARGEAIASIEKQSILIAQRAEQIEDPTVATLVALEAWNIVPPAPTAGLDEIINAPNWRERHRLIEGAGGVSSLAPSHTHAAIQLRRNLNRLSERIYRRFESGSGKVTFSPDRSLAAIGYESGHYYVTNLSSNSYSGYTGHEDYIVALFFNSSGSTLYSVSKHRVEAVNVHDGSIQFSIQMKEKDIGRAAISYDFKKLALGSWDGDVSVLDLESRQISGSRRFGDRRPWIGWAANGNLLIGDEKALYDIPDGNFENMQNSKMEVEHDICNIAVVQPSMALTIIEENSWLSIIDGGSSVRFQLKGAPKIMSVVAVRDAHNRVYAGDDRINVSVWDIEQKRKITSLECDDDRITSIATSPDHGLISAGTQDGHLCVWDTQDYTLVWRSHEMNAAVSSVEFLSDHSLASFSMGGELRVWDLKPKYQVRTLAGCEQEIRHIIFSPAGDYLYGSGSTLLKKGICRWAMSDPTLVEHLKGFRLSNQFYPFDQDKQSIFLTGRGGKVHRFSHPELVHEETIETPDAVFTDAGLSFDKTVIVGRAIGGGIWFWADEPRAVAVRLSKEFPDRSDPVSVWGTTNGREFLFLSDSAGRGYIFDGHTGQLRHTIVASSKVRVFEILHVKSLFI